jgi:predicted ATPase/class 3 adenylate cyclase
MSSPPTGTVTFLFTDIEGSTKLWERDPEAMSKALSRHDELLREHAEAHGGFVFKTVGDAFYVAFSSAPEAVEAALEAQRSLLAEEWEQTDPLRVRMALRTGKAEERGEDYFGPTLNRVARLLSAGHGGQVLISLSTQELVRDQLPLGAELMDLGERRLKDLFGHEHVFELTAPGLPSSFPPLKTLDARLNNLPTQPTPLVGREREVTKVSDLLRRADVRLLTLTGTGGTGKTRLALQSAAELIDEFEDGVFFVALDTISDHELVASTVAHVLGVTEGGDQPLEERLKEYLHERESLLLLDNFEQVVEATPLLEGLLAAAPRLKVIVTSRVALRLYGEHEFPVPPLELPDTRRLPKPEDLAQYEAVKLFIERARAVKPDFVLTNENASAVAEICARLDGLPLAIELAAARIRLLPPQAMLARLGSRLKLLSGGARNLPERQRTLRGAIEWSHGLLAPEEQILFARISVFAGGCTLEAIEAVCNAEGDLTVDSLEGVSALLEKSLLRQEEGPDGEPRFVMLETIHEYAREKLEEGEEAEEIKRAHAQYFLALAEEAEPELRGPDQFEWFERLEAEHDNLRALLSWSLESGGTELGLRLAGALGEFWYARGHYREGKGWLEGVLAKDGGSTLAATRAKALEAVGWLANERGDIEGAEAAAEEGLSLSAQAGIESTRNASFLRILGATARIRGDHERANELYKESLALSREAGDRWGIAQSLINLGSTAHMQGDHERAKELYEEGLILSRELGGAQPLADFLISVGYTSLLESDHERATALNEEAAALLREQRHRGDLQYAVDNLGWAALVRGDHQQARKLFEESLRLCWELGDRTIAAESLEGLACVAEAEGEAERATRLFGVAETLREAVGYHQTPEECALREPYLTTARSRMEEAEWAEERAMTLAEAISYALEDGKDC